MLENVTGWLLLGLLVAVGLFLVVTRGTSCPLLLACAGNFGGGTGGTRNAGHLPDNPNQDVVYEKRDLKDIYLAGGCFWGVEAYIARIYGVAQVTSGYANGRTENPTYEDVCQRGSGHAETVHVRYDPRRLPLEKLLGIYFGIIDPTVQNRQGPDVGAQYRTGIYYVDSQDVPVIEAVVAAEASKYDRPIVTEVMPLIHFYAAEDYHQEYLEKNPGGYCHVDFSTLPARAGEQEEEGR